LTVLRKLPKSVDRLTIPLEKERDSILSIQAKLNSGIEVFEQKTKQVDEERKGNEKWRA
jgi:hypothetical protein